MRVVIAGGHGRIARKLERVLAGRGDRAEGLVRDRAGIPDLESAGAHGVVCDLERASVDEIEGLLRGADAVVFAAGAGAADPVRTDAVDRGGSVKVGEAAQRAEVGRLVQVSSTGAGRLYEPGHALADYLNAKTRAEDDLRRRDLDWTIVRPGLLTDAPGSGTVSLAAEPPPSDGPHGAVSRDDVAELIAALLPVTGARGLTVEVTEGATPIDRAVRAVAAPAPARR